MSDLSRYVAIGALVLGAWGLAACDKDKNGANADAGMKDAHVRILWTNDTHAYLTPNYHREEGDAQYVERAKEEGKLGGMAHIATVLNKQRNEMQGKTLTLDAGDTWHGTIVPLRLNGKPVLDVMNAMGYDAMVPGNVEFIYGKEILTDLIKNAKFPIVMANIFDLDFGERVKLDNLHPYIVKQVGNKKIGIIGMTYQWNSKTVAPSQVEGWSFGLREQEIQEDIDHLRNNEKVDAVVMLSHMGWPADMKYASIVDGIDIIVGAHTHDILYKPTIVRNEKSKRDVLIVQAGSQGKMVGQLDLKLENGRVSAYEQTLIPVRSKDIQPDAKIAKMIEDARAPYKAELERVIGRTETMLYRLANWQNTADNMITDAVRERSKTDLAFSASWRFGATVLPGPITVEDIYNFIPSEAPVITMKMKGADLKEVLEEAIDNVQAEDAFSQVGGDMLRYSGMEIVVDLKKEFPNRVQSIKIGGKPMDPNKAYNLAGLNAAVNNDARITDRTETKKVGPKEVIAYIEEKKVIAPKLDNRITDPQGRILADNVDIQAYWSETGRADFDLAKDKVYRYGGVLKGDKLSAERRQ